MSADPKSLAALAITTTKAKPANDKLVDKRFPQSKTSNLDGDDRGRAAHHASFRSTDEFIAGWTAAFINTTALFPINKLIFRQMAGGHGAQIAADQMKEEGK